MSRRLERAGAFALAVLALSVTATTAQGPPPPTPVPPQQAPPRPAPPVQPARDTSFQPAVVGSGSIGGVVTTDESIPRPLRRVLLTLNGAGLRNGRLTVSDDEGRFVFASLPAGRFTLSGSRPGFLTSYYGARRPWRSPGTQIAIEPGQKVTDLAFKIVRGAVITGVVRDPNGQPQNNLRIQVLENRPVNGEPTWAPVSSGNGSAQTDDRGMYRVFGLAPGTYLVAVAGTPLSTAARLTTDAEVQWAMQQALAASRTAASVPAGTSPGPAVDTPSTVGYAPLYYPGATDPAAGVLLTVGPGEERSGIDMTMQFVPTARIQGTITLADGQPATNVQIALVPQGRKPVSSIDGPMRSGVDQNGRFMFQGVRPGPYTLVARAQGRPPVPVPPPTAIEGLLGVERVVAPSAPSPFDLWAQTDLGVSGRDQLDVRLTLQAGMTLSGRVVYESATAGATADPSRVSIVIRPAPNQTAGTFGQLPSGPATANGTFTLPGVAPGMYLMSSNQSSAPGGSPGSGWVLKSIMVKGQDALEVPFEVLPNESISDVVITYTDQITDLTGRLIDSKEQPVAGYFVVLIPTSRSAWVPGSRRLRFPARTSPDGRYRVANLPPGEYFMVALTEFDQQDLYDPTFLEQLAAAAFKITLAEGEKKVMDLKVAGER